MATYADHPVGQARRIPSTTSLTAIAFAGCTWKCAWLALLYMWFDANKVQTPKQPLGTAPI